MTYGKPRTSWNLLNGDFVDYDKLEIPRKLAISIVVLRDLPSTNAKLAFAIISSAATGIFLVLAGLFRVTVNQDLLNNWYMFIGGWATLGTIQYGIKRKTFQPDAPAPTP